MRKELLAIAAAAVTTLAFGGRAQAGGYDTPMLYSARHMGMGGTAVSYVSDPSALFHNPAGLGRVQNLSLLGDFSLLVGGITSSPASNPEATSIESGTTVAPFFLVGGAYRIPGTPIVAGLAVYPVASAGAEYEYQNIGGTMVRDMTKLVFIEASPGVAVELPQRITLGASYRVTYVNLVREQEPVDPMPGALPPLAFDMVGFNFLGFRAGAQWEAVEDHLSLGVAYRHETVTEVTVDEGRALNQTAYDMDSEFTLPSRLSAGVRGDYHGLGLAFDFEYAWNSQNVASIIGGDLVDGDPSSRVEFANIFAWSDAVTLRTGAEYTIRTQADALHEDGRGDLALRLGFVYDQKTSNPSYPTAFGTPPGATQVLTVGAGWDGGAWEVNAGYAYRFGTAEVTAADIAARDVDLNGDGAPDACVFCSHPGDYAIALHGLYVDFSYDIE